MPCCYKNQVSESGIEEVAVERKKQPYLFNSAHINDVPADFGPGYYVEVTGHITSKCSRFAIDFLVEDKPTADIAFHLNPRIVQKYIVRNDRINNVWGDELTATIVKFDELKLQRNMDFHIGVFITDMEYMIAVNGNYICQFPFRIPPSKVKHVEVRGAVQVSGVSYRKIPIFPEIDPDKEPTDIPVGKGISTISEESMGIPITKKIPVKLKQGMQLEIYGRVKILPHSFYINLQEGYHCWPHPNIHLHLNPRFSTVDGHHYFVRNSWINGKWGKEERTAGGQFTPGTPFSIAIRRENDYFSILVDGKLVTEYRDRADADKIEVLFIYGDVIVKHIYLNETSDNDYHLKNKVANKITL